MINRMALEIDKNHCALMMMVDEEHKNILAYAIAKDVHLSRYWFMQMFEYPMCHDYHTNMHFYMTEITIGRDPIIIMERSFYPIRADFKVGLRFIEALRTPYRNHAQPLPDYQKVTLNPEPPVKVINPVVETVIVKEDDLFS